MDTSPATVVVAFDISIADVSIVVAIVVVTKDTMADDNTKSKPLLPSTPGTILDVCCCMVVSAAAAADNAR